jgi:hypothetical protein
MRSKEEMELEQMLAGAKEREEFLVDRIIEIASIIYYQDSLKEQDRWLNTVVNDGLYTPAEDE